MNKPFDLKKITTPVLQYLLKDHLAHPLFFLIKCKLTMGTFIKRAGDAFPEELLDLAALPLWIYMNLKEKIGQEKAFEIMRIALLTAGVAKQNMLFETVQKGRSFETFVERELEINRTGTTRWNTLKVVGQTPMRFEVEVTRCLFHELACHVGVPEVTKLVCQVDNAVFSSYMPEEIVFHRQGVNQRISDGAKRCRFIWEKIA